MTLNEFIIWLDCEAHCANRECTKCSEMHGFNQQYCPRHEVYSQEAIEQLINNLKEYNNKDLPISAEDIINLFSE